MVEAVLYVLSGAILYAGIHHLFLGVLRATLHLQFAAMYLLLTAFVVVTAPAFGAQTTSIPIEALKLSVSTGTLLWIGLIWYVAFHTRCKPLLLLDLLTAAWLVLLIRNTASLHGLLYVDNSPIELTELSVQQLAALRSTAGSWWNAVKLTTLASLLFCFYAGLRMFSSGNKQAALTLLTGLSILAAVSLADHLLSTASPQLFYFAPFGFIGFLAVHSLYALVLAYRQGPTPNRLSPPPRLTFNPELNSFDAGLLNQTSPAGQTNERHAASTAAAGNSKTAETTTAAVIEPEEEAGVHLENNSTQTQGHGTLLPVSAPSLQRSLSTLTFISDNLIDVAVYATMVLNRLKHGNLDYKVLEMLCQKIRTKAIKTRRLANKLSRNDSAGEAKRS